MAEQTIEQQITSAQQDLLHKASEVRNALESVKTFMQEHEQADGTIKNAQLAVLMGILRNPSTIPRAVNMAARVSVFVSRNFFIKNTPPRSFLLSTREVLYTSLCSSGMRP